MSLRSVVHLLAEDDPLVGNTLGHITLTEESTASTAEDVQAAAPERSRVRRWVVAVAPSICHVEAFADAIARLRYDLVEGSTVQDSNREAIARGKRRPRVRRVTSAART